MRNIFKKNVYNHKKIFCISTQRTGTTSVGNFFKDYGYNVAGYNRERSTQWSVYQFLGDYESIFNSADFKHHQVFEDNPWFADDFYKYLYHKFPNSIFVHFTRDSDKWFDSMVNHSNGKTLGNTYRHCKQYERLPEFYKKLNSCLNSYNFSKIDNLLDLDESNREHYKLVYETRNKEIRDFFNLYANNSRYIHLNLEDKEKWQKLGSFFNLSVDSNYNSHKNKSHD